jgi:hypothetical protein
MRASHRKPANDGSPDARRRARYYDDFRLAVRRRGALDRKQSLVAV